MTSSLVISVSSNLIMISQYLIFETAVRRTLWYLRAYGSSNLKVTWSDQSNYLTHFWQIIWQSINWPRPLPTIHYLTIKSQKLSVPHALPFLPVSLVFNRDLRPLGILNLSLQHRKQSLRAILSFWHSWNVSQEALKCVNWLQKFYAFQTRLQKSHHRHG